MDKKLSELNMVASVVTPVAVAVEVSAVNPSAPPPYSSSNSEGAGVRPAVKPTSLAELVGVLKRELQVDGSLVECVEKSCELLGISITAGNLLERASMCYDQLFNGSSQAAALERAGRRDFIMSDKSWEAGKPGEGWESFSNNPWTFKKEGTFVTERDGCGGFYSLTPDARAPGGMKLRLDWDGQQRGMWTEFEMARPDSDPLFLCCDSSPGLKAWDIRQVPPHEVKPASKTRTYIIPPILQPLVQKRTDAMSVRAVAAMRVVAASLDDKSGPKPSQKYSYHWFDSTENWKAAFPLHRAAMRGDMEVLQTLLEGGKDVNEPMKPWRNMHPLCWAAAFNQVHAATMLVEYGADLEYRSKRGSALEVADREGHQEVGVVFETFYREVSGGDHAGQGTRKRQNEENWARIAFPIAGYPVGGADEGAYYDQLGCCCFVWERTNDHGGCQVGSYLIGGCLIIAWTSTLCYQPCGWMRGSWLWLGDCPCTEHRVTHSFVENHPASITRGPAKYRYDNGIPTKYTHY